MIARLAVLVLTWLATSTAAIAAMEHPAQVRIDVDRATLDALIGSNVSSIDYGSFQWLADPGRDERLNGLVARHSQHPYQLRLGGRSFDPLIDPPPSDGAAASSAPANWYLVQLYGPTRRQWMQQLLGTGLRTAQYIHPYTYIVWAGDEQIAQASDFDFVRWIGPFIPDFRLDDNVPDGDLDETLQVLALTIRIEDDTSIVDAVTGSGGIIRAINTVNRYLQVMYLGLPNIRGSEIAKIPGVYAVQAIREAPATRGEAQNQLNAGNQNEMGQLLPGYLDWLQTTGHDGRGIVVAVVDQHGIRSSHADLAGRVRPCLPLDEEATSCGGGQYSDHATHVAGAIAGTGRSNRVDAAGFLRGLGMAPGVELVPQQFNSTLSGENLLPGGILALFRESAANGARIANNSWGLTTRARGYDIPTMQVDMIVRDAEPTTAELQPILPVWAIMNGRGDGRDVCEPGSLGSPDEAKNLLAVGATEFLDSDGTIMRQRTSRLAHRSGHGNACDGRRVPHLVAPGCSTDNATAGGDNEHGHLGFCGTSMAAPNVTGAAALFMARHRDLYGTLPSPALVKAALTATAIDLAGHHNADRSAIMGHRPDRFQGFGRLHLDPAVNPSVPVIHVDQEHVFTDSGQRWTRPIYAADADQPVQIMLAWTDAPGHGLGGDTPAWVNDLDLDVGVGGAVFRGNVIGIDGWSAAGGEADPRNNLEAVYLSPGQHQGQRIDLSVLAANIAADALDPYEPDFAAPRQDFALVCYNCTATPPPALNLIFADGFD